MNAFVDVIWILTIIGGCAGVLFIGLDVKRVRDRKLAASNQTESDSGTEDRLVGLAGYDRIPHEVLQSVGVVQEPADDAFNSEEQSSDSLREDIQEIRADLRSIRRQLETLRCNQYAQAERVQRLSADLPERLQNYEQGIDVRLDAIQLALEDLRFASGAKFYYTPKEARSACPIPFTRLDYSADLKEEMRKATVIVAPTKANMPLSSLEEAMMSLFK